MICPHCSEDTSTVDFCSKCGQILPTPPDRSHYEVLGYDREFLTVDQADLEKRFFDLSKKYHPDRFASKSLQEVQFSHEHSSAVNNAYRTLRNPISRAKYFVEKRFGSTEEKSAKVPVNMADLFFEVQDVLDTIREANGAPPEAAVKEVRDAESMLRSKIVELEKQLDSKFSEYDAAPGDSVLTSMQDILSERSYIRSFLRQIDRVLNREEEDIEEEL